MWRWTFVQDRIFRPWDGLSVWNRRIECVGRSHSDELNWVRRRTFHELNSLSLVRLMKSSMFGVGLSYKVLKYNLMTMFTVVIIVSRYCVFCHSNAILFLTEYGCIPSMTSATLHLWYNYPRVFVSFSFTRPASTDCRFVFQTSVSCSDLLPRG